MTKYLHNMFEYSFSKEWYETYWVIDIHKTVIQATYDIKDDSVKYYPYAKEVLQILTQRKDINLIMWTSSFSNVIDEYIKKFAIDNILFNSINENVDISSKNGNFGFYEQKFYFNVLFDDKAAFLPNRDWKPIYDLLIEYEKVGFLPNKKWTTKF